MPEQRDATVAAFLARALAAPAELTAEEVAEALDSSSPGAAESGAAVAHGLLAAVAYGRPDLLSGPALEALARRLPEDAHSAPAAVAQTFSWLAFTPLAESALRLLLASSRQEPSLYTGLGSPAVDVLAGYAARVPELWSVEDLARALPVEPALRELYTGLVLEPLLHRRPDLLTVDALRVLDGTLAGSRAWQYALGALAERPRTPGSAAAFSRRATAGAFPHRALAVPLRHGPFHLVVLMNVRFGLGDELIRVGPFVQALLDGNPEARATVITPRPFLYDHPRVGTLALGSPEAESVLRRPKDGLFVLHEPVAHRVTLRPDLAALARAEEESPFLLLRGDTGRGYFLFERVRVGRTELAFRCGLDRIAVPRVYEPTRRLLLELGLPLRLGEEQAAAGSAFTAEPSQDAERVWHTLVPAGRRAAVVNPFGGAHRLKGYLPAQAAEVAYGIAGIVREGYRVVLLPNGEPWARHDTLRAILDALEPAVRADVAVAPDPAEEAAPWAGCLRERADLSWADRTVRVHKYLIERADLVVAVEGWVVHLAYQLGRPFRLVLRTDSDVARWHPPQASARQRVVEDLGAPRPPIGSDALAALDRRPIAPSLPRRAMLAAALRGAARLGGKEALELLRRATESPDAHTLALALRLFAGVAAGGEDARSAADLLTRHLADRRAKVRAAAADGLLALGLDYTALFGPRSEALLRAHAAIGRQQWPAVVALGTAALPALAQTAEDESPMYRDEAAWAIAQVLGPLADPLRARLRR